MSEFEQLNEIKKNVSTIHCPVILQQMNKKAQELEAKINKIKQIIVK